MVINAYFRLYKDRLQKEIEADYAVNAGGETKLVHRNRYLTQKFKEELEEVQEHVRINRVKANERPKQEVCWVDSDSISNEEKRRREVALEYSS
jgi:hypothetical protein